MAHVLIIDNDRQFCKTTARQLCLLGYHVDTAAAIQEGLAQLAENSFDLILLDMRLPDGCGLDIVPRIKSLPHAPEIIVLTGYAEQEDARQAISSGVWDYVQKPCMMEELKVMLERALAYRLQAGQQKTGTYKKQHDIIGNNALLRQALDITVQVAGADINVLISGETGTGKELFARAIHENSARAAAEMVVLDCSVMPENLVEDILFGHSKGAFTGANSDRTGLVRQAHRGTLFLDEIGELPLGVQTKLLRVLQERRFRPIGAQTEIQVDFRLVAATNRNLTDMVKARAFREDLLHRINTVTIDVPSLRERMEDIPELVAYFISKLCRRYQKPAPKAAPELLQLLQEYHWPGNVRELINVLDRIIVTTDAQDILLPIHLPPEMRSRIVGRRFRPQPSPHSRPAFASDSPSSAIAASATPRLPEIKIIRKTALEKAELAYLTALMQQTGGNVSAAARVAGLAKSQVYNLLKKYGLS